MALPPPLNSCSPVAIFFAPCLAQVLIFVLRILAAEFVVEMLTLRRRADPDVERSHTARVADGLNQLKEAIAFSFQVRATHFLLSICV